MTMLNAADRRRMGLSMALDLLANHAPTESIHTAHWIDIERTGLPFPYLCVLADILELLGLVQRYQDSLVLQVVSPQAGYALRILSDLLSQQHPLFSWLKSGSGKHILPALEQIRIRLLTPQGAAPVRELQAVIGLICRQNINQSRHYLLVFDSDAGEWQAPGGHYEVFDRSLRNALLRELEEELELKNLANCSEISIHPLGASFHLRRLSPSLGILTDTLFHPFLVTLPLASLRMHSLLYWATAREIMCGHTDNGQRINKSMIQPLLARLPLQLDEDHSVTFAMGMHT